MEPLNTTVHVTGDNARSGWARRSQRAALPPRSRSPDFRKQDRAHNHYIGGGFGRRLETDSVEQAVAFAKQVSYPLKVIWTREEDIRHDIPRPMYYDRISAVLGSDGRPVWYEDHITGGSVLARWAPPAMGKDGMDDDLIECAAETPYDIPNHARRLGAPRHAGGPRPSAGGAVSVLRTTCS
jgi:isoquinoline 1-oxidoreductase beta subunit